MNKTLALLSVVLAIVGVPLFSGCGGKLAETGCATVTGISCPLIRLDYPNGKVKFKRLIGDNIPKDVRTVGKHLHKPARFVETDKGGTLTFPNGDTVLFSAHKPE